jgi:hypothetical protein
MADKVGVKGMDLLKIKKFANLDDIMHDELKKLSKALFLQN